MPALQSERYEEQTIPNSDVITVYRKGSNNALYPIVVFNNTTSLIGTVGQYFYDASGNLVAYITTNQLTVQAPSIRFDVATASPVISQETRLTDAAPADLTIRSQAPYASATGANRNPGDLAISVPSPAAGGSAGNIKLSISTAEVLRVYSAGILVSAANVRFAETVSTPTIKVDTRTTDAACTDLVIQSQTPLATASSNKSPGNLVLTVPDPVAGGTVGKVSVKFGSTEYQSFNVNAVFVRNSATPPTASTANGGMFFVHSGAFKYLGQNGTLTVVAPA